MRTTRKLSLAALTLSLSLGLSGLAFAQTPAADPAAAAPAAAIRLTPIQSIKAAHAQRKAERQAAVAQRKADLKAAHDKKVADLKATNDNKIADLKATHDKKITDLKAAHDKKIAELKKLEATGYQPAAKDPNYPQDLQNAEKKAATSGQ
ncbi:hypothetical protein BGC_62440 [Burkholderia sp. 3C]